MKVKIAEKSQYSDGKITYRNYRLVSQCVPFGNESRIKPSYLWLYEETDSLMVPLKPCFSVSEALKNLMEALRFNENRDFVRLEIHYENGLENNL